jgi:hypothetical protein
MRDQSELKLPCVDETKPDLELTLDELETVSAGKGKSSAASGKSNGNLYLRFDFKMVFVS